MTFVVVDYRKGNLRSVQKALELAGAQTLISADPADINKATALVLPGVGSFADASAFMLQSGQMQTIRDRVQAGVPFLGICLGMQLLFERGNEGTAEGAWAEGLGLLPGSCRAVRTTDQSGKRYKVPHVGWNQIEYTTEAAGNPAFATLCAGIEPGSYFYFTHSYQCEPADPDDVLATTTHAEPIPCMVAHENIYAVQHHPEKSSHKGLEFVQNFVRLVESRTQ